MIVCSEPVDAPYTSPSKRLASWWLLWKSLRILTGTGAEMVKRYKRIGGEKSTEGTSSEEQLEVLEPSPLSHGCGGLTARFNSVFSASQQWVPGHWLVKNAGKLTEEPHLHITIVPRYDGEMRDGLLHGKGTAYFEGGHVYEGMFANGYMHGHGVYTWADGIKYEGEFIFNIPAGHGTYIWLDGSCYEGDVVSGIRHGVGTYQYGTKAVFYRGQWNQGKKHGKGIIYYNKEMTSWYDGDWVNNVREGWGVRRYPSGNVYEGQWRNNARHGKGTMKWLGLGQQYTGQWENGIQQGKGTHTWFLRRIPGSQYALRNEYTGDFVQGMREGEGKFCYASGAVYSGRWQNNKKHGQGTFIFKDGRIFEGEFADDRMVEFPTLWTDDAQLPEIRAIRTQTPPYSESESARKIIGTVSGCVLLGPDMALDIQSLLARFPEAQRDPELRQMKFAVLRYVADLRTVYNFYSSLSSEESPDNTFLLTRLQLWRLLKDCQVHRHGITLVEVDRLLQEDGSPEKAHSPFCTLLFRRFLSCLVILAYHIYHKEIQSSSNVLVGCFSKFMRNNVLPNATHVKGMFFCHPVHALLANNYVKQCWEIYKNICCLHSDASHDLTMTMRHFVWMLKDLDLFDNELTIGKVVEILCFECPAVEEVSLCSLDFEINFLEFFEALLRCAEVKTCSVMIPPVGDVAGEEFKDTQSPLQEESSLDAFMLKSFSPKVKSTGMLHFFKSEVVDVEHSAVELPSDEAGPCQQKSRELENWVRRTHLFFCKIFFPAYKYNLFLRKEVQQEQVRKEQQLRKEEQEERLRKEAQTRFIHTKAKETARQGKLQAAEEDERRKLEQEAEEPEKVDALKEVSTHSPAGPRPVASTTITKQFFVNEKRRKK